MYDKIDELESSLIDAKAKKQTIEAEKLTGDNIYKVLIYFDKLYKVMNDIERRQLITALISEIQASKKAFTSSIVASTAFFRHGASKARLIHTLNPTRPTVVTSTI